MRSDDYGTTWTNLGIILKARPEHVACGTGNAYFVGGIGDVSAVLNDECTDLYIFFSQYSPTRRGRGCRWRVCRGRTAMIRWAASMCGSTESGRHPMWSTGPIPIPFLNRMTP